LGLAVLGVVTLGLAPLAGEVRAAVGWNLTASPLTLILDRDQVLTFRATDTAAGFDIACVRISISNDIEVRSASVTATSGPRPWTVSHSKSGGSGTRVSAINPNDLAPLGPGDWVEFEVDVTADELGLETLTALAYEDDSCTGPALSAIALVLTIVALPIQTPVPTPTPAPSAPPTPSPSPAPSIVPIPSLVPSILPSAAPSLRPSIEPTATPSASPAPSIVPSPLPGEPEPPRSPAPSADPASASPAPSPAAIVPPAGPPGPGGPPAPSDDAGTSGAPSAGTGQARPGLTARQGDPIGGSGFETITFIGDGFTWLIPTFVAGVPGIIIALVLALQVVAGTVWLPSVRRLRREDDARQRRLRAWLDARPRP
jgi:hypothetical protein